MMKIVPYEAVGPVRFGMTTSEVREVLGEPSSITKSKQNSDVLRYEGLVVTVTQEGVAEVGLLPEIPIVVAGIDVFSSPAALKRLCMMDGAPQECAGFIILLKLGITLTGFHDRDETQKAVTAFVSGRWDSLRSQIKPVNLKALLSN